MTTPMKVIWTARALVRHGSPVKEVAECLNISEAIVRKYTKAERNAIKNEKKAATY